ncbi:hypothetical protein [Paenibacillus prosopidis]|uniref:Lipoprotein n=1 Tax=Paenibacillus prosopidis TaxID=630520 RepID=A0A368VCU7_9BACL|nr:hypothetical protein [Paenibacillus prosopidis]RCW39107.1 hypothetical protein DFP97_1752 [Paenibacillus prosopidis]
MLRLVIIIVFLGSFLVGCGNSIESFEGQIEKVETNRFIVDCSDEANKGKRGAIIDIGYGCPVQFTDQTTFRNESGNSLKMSDFSPSSIVNVILVKPVNIRKNIEKEKSFVLTAKEIVLLTRAEDR